MSFDHGDGRVGPPNCSHDEGEVRNTPRVSIDIGMHVCMMVGECRWEKRFLEALQAERASQHLAAKRLDLGTPFCEILRGSRKDVSSCGDEARRIV